MRRGCQINFEEVFNEHYTHFNERLILRYNMSITIEEYRLLLNSFKSEIKGLGSHTYGTVQFRGETLWVIRKNEYKTLGTVFPKDVAFHMPAMIRMVFPNNINNLCLTIYNDIRKELDACRTLTFETQTEAWRYYESNYVHSPLLIKQWKGHLTNVIICRYIRRLLDNDNPAIQISFKRKQDFQRKSKKLKNAINT